MVAGGLFTQFFLQDGIRETEAYRGLDPGAVAAAAERLRVRWQALASMPSPSEAETEGEFIFPALDLLGWQYLHQPIADRRRRDVADALLFSTPEAKAVARPLRPVDRFVHGAVIVENEARDTPLDRAPAGRETPASQILRYMSRAETHSNGTLRWGLLTNGRTWRLYYGRVPSRAEGFIGIDVADLLDPPPLAPTSVPDGAPPDHWFRVFLLLFRRDALQSTGPQGTTFLDLALAEGRHYQARVTADLSRIVFERVFPELVAAIARHDPQAQLSSPAWREVARHAAVRLLFRLLFLFFAEDRDLLPVRHPGYLRYAPVRPERRDHLVGGSPTRAMVGWPGSWQAVWLGNRLDRSPATNAASGGGANRRAVTCVKPEQASKGKLWTPTRPEYGEGSTVWGSSRQLHLDRSTGVMGTARRDR